ncbi:PEP-CTERM sorting domain-containing protein [Duganella callida]|uniref:PEP-CTERM sorting domain-containing protein n=2 Tax=Duganella callida TaxID=2561932 RepID=A0A4Y9S8Y7_9BURK|nr:PEP-CTERM sorting domain-containing protein [Duganella callida]
MTHVNLLASYAAGFYTEDGFVLQSSASVPNSLLAADVTYNAGSYAMAASPLATTTLMTSNASAFSISSIDLLRRPAILNWTVTFTGVKSDASVVTQSFTITNNHWNTFNFNAGFTNLASLSWDEGLTRLYAFDNINVSAVPEPASYAMLIGGLGLLGLARRRQRS